MTIKPEIDPWELMIEHNQRIQRLEKQIQEVQTAIHNHKSKIEQLISAVNANTQLQQINQDTLNQLMDNHTALTGLVADMAQRSTSGGLGQH